MLKVVTIVGTRPEIIRLSRLIPLLDRHCRHVLVHTGQNSGDDLSGRFFRELSLRDPDEHLSISTEGLGAQLSTLFASGYDALIRHRPDAVVLLGDTNSGLLAIVARRLGIPVFHLEAGNRCFDSRVPEEVNRKIIDHASAVHLPYSQRSRENLLVEGIRSENIHVIGNPIFEVLQANRDKIAASKALHELALNAGEYHLATLHRAETVDVPEFLQEAMKALELVAQRTSKPVVLSMHPRTRHKMTQVGYRPPQGIICCSPFGFHDFAHLLGKCACVLTDSGTVQEEACILMRPCVVMRDVTERPELLEAGSLILSGLNAETTANAVEFCLARPGNWTPPPEYIEPHVAEKVARILLGHSRTTGGLLT
jgi:UDP-N-acetylglucosamine 2-epimerase (non-hydrolysing)